MAMPYNVCGGMQDNYNWCGPSAVRGAAGIAQLTTGQTLQGGDGFVVLQDPTDYRIAYSESQDGNIVRVDRVTGETMSSGRSRRPASRLPLALGHAADVLAARSEGHLRRREQGVPLDRPRPVVDGRSATDLTDNAEPRRHRDDGREGQRHPHLAQRRHLAVARDRRRSPSRRSAPACIYAGTDDGNAAGDARRRQDAGRTSTDKFPGAAEGHLRVGGRAVAIRRRHGLRDVRRPSPERLRDLHLREQGLRPDLAVDRTAT